MKSPEIKDPLVYRRPNSSSPAPGMRRPNAKAANREKLQASERQMRAPTPGIVSRSRYNMPGFAGIGRPNFHVRRARRRAAAVPDHGSFSQRVKRFVEGIPLMLSHDVTAGLLLIGAAILAILWANSPWREAYTTISNFAFGPESLHLHLTVSEWAQDGLLTIFFFVVGLELKTEFVTGSLRDPREAALPMIAAVFGMIGPALLYMLIVTIEHHTEALHGWAIPAATDIAFAVAILAIFGSGLPPAARTFLLTLAVVDDLLGIIVIAVFYSNGIDFIQLALALLMIVIFGFFVQKRITHWWLLIPLGVLAWYFMHRSGVHSTIAGVLLGMAVPAKRRPREEQLTHHFTELVNPISAGFAVPVFAFFAAGVNIVDTPGGPLQMLTHPVAIAVALSLPLGKFIGISGSVAVLTRFTPLKLGHGVDMGDIVPISFVAGIGFTVALLIAHLAFKDNAQYTHAGSLGVVMGTLLAVIIGAILLQWRTRTPVRGK